MRSLWTAASPFYALERFTPDVDTSLDFQPFTTAQAAEDGLTRRDLIVAERCGTLRRLFRGVYVDARQKDSRALRLRAIGLVKPDGAVACNETAAWLYGVDAFKPSEQYLFEPSFVVPHSTTRISRAGVRSRQAYLDAPDITVLDDIPVTTPTRTVSDLLRRLYRPYALAAADAFARSGLVEIDECVDFVHRLRHYPGIVQARSLSVLIEPRAESPGESWQRLRIHDAGFPPPTPQFEIVDVLGRTRFLDLAYPELRIGSEYDGRGYHTAEAHQLHDQERRSFLTETEGWRWVNATRERLFGSDTSFEDELGALLGMTPRSRRWGT